MLSDKASLHQRRLAAILFADMVGYSRLMEESESQTLQLLGEYRQIAGKAIQERSGKIIDTIGDGIFAAFGSAVEAVRAAAAIQKELAGRNGRRASDQPLLVRIGIHLGDVLQEAEDLLGSGVNVASRIQVLASPGGIYVSGEVYQQVRNQVGLSFRDLGERQLRNIKEPIRIYELVLGEEAVEAPGEVREPAPAASQALPSPKTNLPTPVSELIGREAELLEVTNLLTARRLITLIGAGGVGKTRLGLEVARRLLPKFPDGAFLADLAPLSSPDHVPVTVAVALNLTLVGDAVSPERIAAAVGPKRLLLVLDNCEHVIEAAARIAEALLHASPDASVLATSREPLRVEGEYVYRVPALAVPAEDVGAEDALQHDAVRLFVTRAQAAGPLAVLDTRSALAAAGICRRLEGMPLAIEFAAARVATFGIEGIAARLHDRFRLLTRGSRTAAPRHQTLRSTLDWSYELLSESERVVLRRLAVFAGSFTAASAGAITSNADIPAPDVVEHLGNLITKSLVSAEVGGPVVYYRLLETTRAYARDKLIESGELERFARQHVEYYRDLFERAGAEWNTSNTDEWLSSYGREIDNLRAALDWAFGPGGDSALGVALTTAAVPLWFQLSLLDECRGRVERAISTLMSNSERDARREMELHAALGWSLMYTKDPARETAAAWTTTLACAERLQDTDYQLRSLWGLWASHVNNGEFKAASALARRFFTLAATSRDPADALIGDRMLGAALHFLGDQKRARRHIERMLSRYVAPSNRSHIVRFQFDQRVTARITLARVQWLQGSPDQAMRTVASNIEDAFSIKHLLSLCNALAQAACPVSILAGDVTAADRYTTMLIEHTARQGADVWQAYCRCFRGIVFMKRGVLDSGLTLLREGVEELRQVRFVQYYTAFLAALAEGFVAAAQVGQGLAVIDEALVRRAESDEGWLVAELLRVKGELLLLRGLRTDAATAEAHFLQSLEYARRQGALSWELRTATSLARLWHQRRRTDQARKLLAPVYRKFTEGFETPDLVNGKALLDALRP